MIGSRPGWPSLAAAVAVITMLALVVPQMTASAQVAPPQLSIQAITPPVLTVGQQGQPYRDLITATGGVAPYQWSATGLPSGLTVQETTGTTGTTDAFIEGTPQQDGPFYVDVIVRDSSGQASSEDFNLEIDGPAMSVPDPTLPGAETDQSYDDGIVVTGGRLPLHFFVAAGADMPPGLDLNPETGVISGDATTPGQYQFTVSVTDSSYYPQTIKPTMYICVAPDAGDVGLRSPASTGSDQDMAGLEAATSAPTLRVKAIGPVNFAYRLLSNSARFQLVAYASGGCPPYRYSWHQDHAPAGSSVVPGSGQGQILNVLATCPATRNSGGVRSVPSSCNTDDLKYTVTVTDKNRQTATAAIVITDVFAGTHESYYSPGNPKERGQWIATLKGAVNSLVEVCAVDSTINDVMDTADQMGNWNPIKLTRVGAAAKIAHGCTQAELTEAKARLGAAAKALQVAEQDPPTGDFASVAVPQMPSVPPPPDCRGLGVIEDQLAACQELSADSQAVAIELYRAILIGDAVATTIEQHSGAVYANDPAAVELQEYAYQAQLAEAAQVVAQENRAARALATLLEHNGLDFTFRQAFVANPVGFLQDAAASLSGTARAAIEAMIQVMQLFTPSIGRSYVNDLSQPLPIGALAKAASSMTPEDVAVLVRQLAAQGQIEAALSSSLLSILGGLATEAGATRTAALASLATDLGRIGGGAGPMLEAACGLTVPPL